MTPIEWLTKNNEAAGQTNLALLAKLYCKNRDSLQVTGWNDFAEGMPFYDGVYGLAPEEAVELAELGHYLQGLVDAFDRKHQGEVSVLIAAEILKNQRWCPGLLNDTDDQSED
jgi:hypothetical protein